MFPRRLDVELPPGVRLLKAEDAPLLKVLEVVMKDNRQRSPVCPLLAR